MSNYTDLSKSVADIVGRGPTRTARRERNGGKGYNQHRDPNATLDEGHNAYVLEGRFVTEKRREAEKFTPNDRQYRAVDKLVKGLSDEAKHQGALLELVEDARRYDTALFPGNRKLQEQFFSSITAAVNTATPISVSMVPYVDLDTRVFAGYTLEKR